ncbi:MAG: dTDP-4-dehydrorhamnose reductase [Bacteroidota bacterium]
MKTILVTGANGQLGNELRVLSAQYSDWKFIFCGHQDLDITNKESVIQFFNQHNIDAVINAAAYTAVDKAESDLDNAMKVNATAVENLALACISHQAFLLHFSTDYVFKGNNTSPYLSTDNTEPIGAYGLTKCKGEEIMQQLFIQNNLKGLIIRTSWVYSSYGNNFVKTMLRLMNERPELKVVADQKGRPTYAYDLAASSLNIVVQLFDGKNIFAVSQLPIYHYANQGEITWHQFACEIATQINYKGIIHPIATNEFPTPAKRPAYSVLNTDSLVNEFKIEIPNWKNSLEICLSKLK